MKRNSIFILGLAAIFFAVAGMKPFPQDNQPGKKKTAHIKVVTIKNGEKQVLDTVIESSDLKVMHMGKGGNFRMIHAPHAPGMRLPHIRAARVRHLQGRNVIDLSDPGIISFQKKKLSGGREKITIIRNEVKHNEEETFDIRVDETVNDKVIKTDIRNAEQEIKVQGKSLGLPVDIKKK